MRRKALAIVMLLGFGLEQLETPAQRADIAERLGSSTS